MLKRTLFFGNPYHISTENIQLKITDKSTGEIKTVPIEDIGFIVFEHPHITFTQSVMQHLAANNTAVVFCDEKYHPSSMLLHLDTNHVQTERFKAQIATSEPLKKQLWQQTIKAKITNQAFVLQKTNKEGVEALQYLSRQVLSGDSTNQEAQAARRYWSKLFGSDFTRERYGKEPNPALNYGYAILRAAVARDIAGSGLLATLGIHHRNKYNSFCLADDIMEPYRPFVDLLVVAMQEKGMDCINLGTQEKAELLSILTIDIFINNNKSPLMVGLSQTTASLSRCFEGKAKKIIYPNFHDCQ
ncbi:MAG: type II CRISPR-associated endonuclease Cas1 [Flavobacteriales bacterium]|nr:type II CRISPR-associated endonuclease Cas1 [Flavobacteriales bacterium]